MDELFRFFNLRFGGKARLAVIGGEVRRLLAIDNNLLFPDLLASSHLDILIELTNIKDLALIKEIFLYFKAKQLTDLCFEAKLGDINLEFVGIVSAGRLFTVNGQLVPGRPDLTIERFGYYNDGLLYDESKRGWSDFFSHRLVLMNSNLFLRKYLKILSLKFQTGFEFDDVTLESITNFEDSFRFKKFKINKTFPYNQRLFREYGLYDSQDPYQIGIHVALLYLRARDGLEVTSYIENRLNLRRNIELANVNYRYFEEQIRSDFF